MLDVLTMHWYVLAICRMCWPCNVCVGCIDIVCVCQYIRHIQYMVNTYNVLVSVLWWHVLIFEMEWINKSHQWRVQDEFFVALIMGFAVNTLHSLTSGGNTNLSISIYFILLCCAIPWRRYWLPLGQDFHNPWKTLNEYPDFFPQCKNNQWGRERIPPKNTFL